MGTTWRQMGLAAGLAMLAFTPLRADPPPQASDRPVTVTRGKDLPLYLVVEKFFGTVHFLYTESPTSWRTFLNRLNVQEGSEEAALLVNSALQAYAIRLEVLPANDDPAESHRAQRSHTRSQVQRLRKVWHQFLADWKKAGQPEDVVLDYLETHSRNQVQTYTIGKRAPEDQRELDEIMAEFLEPDGRR